MNFDGSLALVNNKAAIRLSLLGCVIGRNLGIGAIVGFDRLRSFLQAQRLSAADTKQSASAKIITLRKVFSLFFSFCGLSLNGVGRFSGG